MSSKRRSLFAKILIGIGVVLLAVVALLGAAMWYIYDTSHERKIIRSLSIDQPVTFNSYFDHLQVTLGPKAKGRLIAELQSPQIEFDPKLGASAPSAEFIANGVNLEFHVGGGVGSCLLAFRPKGRFVASWHGSFCEGLTEIMLVPNNDVRLKAYLQE